MKASFNNSISLFTSLCLMLFVMFSNISLAVDQTDSVSLESSRLETPVSHNSRTFMSSVMENIADEEGMPRAREDVDPVRTAVVPGKAYIPGNTPQYSNPSYTPNYNSVPQQQEVLPGSRGGQPSWPNAPGYPSTVPQYQSVPQYQNGPQAPINTVPGGANYGTPEPDKTQLKISSRATDPKMQGFLRATSMQQLTTLFHEASQMIDARHVNPPAYETRVKSAVNNLVSALENENFLRANNVNAQSAPIRQVQAQLTQSVNSMPARTATEAVGVMQWAAQLVNRQLGIRQEAVALEFMNGSIDALDKYSSFMPESTAYAPGAELELRKTASLEENIVGVGVELETHPMGAIIVGIVDNSPASELGLKEKDLIVAVKRQSVQGMGLNEVASMLGGPAGAVIEVDIERNGQRFRGSMTRRSIYVSSVTGTKMVDTNNMVGYVRLKQFSDSSRKDLEAALWKLHNQGMKALVLDLRGNPGGLLDQAIEVSNLFLPCGTIVSTRGRNTSDNTVETATQSRTWNVPLTVLVDSNSASASEIFAAAIQENERGVVVGRHSYGKGTVQTHFPLNSVSGMLKLTTAKFYSPTGREMAGAGVTPDVVIPEAATNANQSGYDADIQGALASIQQGLPARLAQQAATCTRTRYQNTGLTNSNPNSPANWGQQLQNNIFGR